MADDLQRSALENQLYQQQLLSGETVVEGVDHDFVKEKERIARERQDLISIQRGSMLSQAAIQGQAGVIAAKYSGQAQKAQMMASVQPQAKTQQQSQQNAAQGGQDPTQALQSPNQEQEAEMSSEDIASAALSDIESMSSLDQQNAMNTLKLGDPQLWMAVNSLKNERTGSQSDLLSESTSAIKPPRSPTPVM